MKIQWSLAAWRDLEGIQDYLIGKSPRGAERIWTRIHRRVGLLADFPFAAPVHGNGPARKLVVAGTPYIVLYLVEGGLVKIEAVFHGARNF